MQENMVLKGSEEIKKLLAEIHKSMSIFVKRKMEI